MRQRQGRLGPLTLERDGVLIADEALAMKWVHTHFENLFTDDRGKDGLNEKLKP